MSSGKASFFLTLVWALIVYGLAFWGWARVPLSAYDGAAYWIDKNFISHQAEIEFRFISAWDAAWYLDIAGRGYAYFDRAQSNLNFYPLYPLAIRVLAFPFDNLLPRISLLQLSGVVISFVSLFVSVWLLINLAAKEEGRLSGVRAVWYLLTFPTAFFLITVYSESLYLFLSVGCFWLMKREKWIFSGLLGGLAALTRPVGIVLIVSLVVEYLLKSRPKRQLLLGSFCFLLIWLLFPLYTYFKFGDPFIMFKAARSWGRFSPAEFSFVRLENQVNSAFSYSSASSAMMILEAAAVILGIVASVWLFKNKKYAYAIYTILGNLIPLTSGVLLSQTRYLLVLFPVFIVLSSWGKNPVFNKLYLLVSSIMLGINIVLFANGFWVA